MDEKDAGQDAPRSATRPGSVRRRLSIVWRRMTAWQPTWPWLFGVLRSFAVSFLALATSLWLLPGTQVTRGAVSVAALAVGVLAVGALLRPLLTRLTVLTGVVGLLLASLLAQALILGVALSVVPTVEPFSFGDVFVASWAAVVVAAVLNWVFDSSSEEVFLDSVMNQALRTGRRHGRPGRGLLVIQLDGVSEPLLRQAMTAGAMPATSRLLRSRSHALRRWYTGLPATTPAGQAVILHGDVTSVPSFRWYDKASQRLLVANDASDIAEVEHRLSDGRGLLADGGVSVSNLLSGDAPTRLLTMSDARTPTDDRGTAAFAVGRFGFVRSFVLFIGEVVTEWFQGRRQRRRDVQPRVDRRGIFVLLRGLTTVVLRDLNISIVAQQMALGRPVIYVNFVDYDEVAHHAGPSRPETIRTLDSLDRVIEFFGELSDELDCHYEIAVVSDHGQAQGTPFRQLNGETLAEVVAGLTHDAAPVVDARRDDHPETWSPAGLLLADAGPRKHRVAEAVRRRRTPDTPAQESPVVVAASGSLAHLYVTAVEGRATAEEVAALHPMLRPGLAHHPGVGVVVCRRGDGVLIAEGDLGWREVTVDGTRGGEGADPLAVYGDRAAADLVSLSGRDGVGDLVLLGTFDRRLGEVTAFEELVGSHGGLGGWQTQALVVHPTSWQLPHDEALTGLELHHLLLSRLEQLGLRREEPADDDDPVESTVEQHA